MKDLFDTDIEIGFTVAFILRRDRSHHMWKGVVEGFSKEMVRVSYTDRTTGKKITSSRMPHNLVVAK